VCARPTLELLQTDGRVEAVQWRRQHGGMLRRQGRGLENHRIGLPGIERELRRETKRSSVDRIGADDRRPIGIRRARHRDPEDRGPLVATERILFEPGKENGRQSRDVDDTPS
jgi:hypothetical protein